MKMNMAWHGKNSTSDQSGWGLRGLLDDGTNRNEPLMEQGKRVLKQ